jgi:hypothetical protein
MVYCVVPRELESELFERMTQYYADDAEVTVIVDRRLYRRRCTVVPTTPDRRVLRERRRRRAGGDSVTLSADVSSGTAA